MRRSNSYGERTGFAATLLILIAAATANATTVGDMSRVTARAALVIDNATGQILFARNPNMPLPPASTTKLLTSILAMESGQLDRNVKVSKYAASMQPSKIGLQTGWIMNMRDLVYAMLVKSANDASVVAAEGLAGSVTNFSRRMNEKAKSLGATNSHFVNPNGLPARGHYTTVHDLAVIVRHALKVPGMRRVLATRHKTIRPRGISRRIKVKTTNKLLGRRPYQIFGKTGYTRRAKRCFAGAASMRGREIIVVVLGSNDLWDDLDLLVNYGLSPQSPPPDWSDKTGWRQALADKPQPRPLPARSRLKPLPQARPARIIAQGDRGLIETKPRFRYHIQVARLRSKTIAEELFNKVAKRGYDVTIEPKSAKGQTYYRVLVRDLADRVIARRVARQLSRELHLETQIIAVRG